MTTVLSAPLGLLVAGVAAVRGQCAVELPGAQALAEAAVLLAELEKLTAVSLARVADVHSRGLHSLAGSPSTCAWVAAQRVGLPAGFVALAKKLEAVPALAAAVAEGRLALPSAGKVATALDKLRRHTDRPDGLVDGQPGELAVRHVIVDGVLAMLAEARGGLGDDDRQLPALLAELTVIADLPGSQLGRLELALLLLAQHLEPGQLEQALDRLVDALLPQQLTDRCENAHQQRAFTMTRSYDGTGWQVTRGQLDAECGELLFTVLTAARATDPDNPADTAAWASRRCIDAGVPADDPGVEARAPRSKVQRDHDALALGLRALLDSGALGTRGKAVPHLLITVPLAALNDEPGAAPAIAASGASIPAPLARRWLSDSHLTRLVLSLGRRVIETSHTQRTLKAHERHALHVQWGGRCAAAGCPSPPGTPLVPHHPNSWASTRTTSYTDSIPVCHHTHHDLHQGHKTIRLRDGRYLSADGWTDRPSG